MPNFKNTLLWSSAFKSDEAIVHKREVEILEQVFDTARDNAAVLVSEISIDLPSYTVHDITHLDALWEVGSQIVGSDFILNPLEGFILGCSFLFHDSAMTIAAYPGGVDEIKKSREWKRTSMRLAANHKCLVDDQIVEVFLREQHAIRAEELPKLAWSGNNGFHYIIENSNYRDQFGDFIGQIAASHWWDHSKLADKFKDKIIPAPAPFPSSWSIDILKLASVLRTADASQIDERRAPSLLRALRSHRLSAYSAKHWTFQNKLTQAQRRDDTLYFASFRPFSRSESKEWWLLHDTLKMINQEIRKTDELLLSCRGEKARFPVRRVANIESPESLESCVPTIGWRPVDTAFSIADIPKLVENLGGNQLYGNDPLAALREIIQNAMDAVRLRKFVDPRVPSPIVELEVKFENNNPIITIRDNGVGMSEATIVDNLLSFGSSGWLSDVAIGEYNDDYPMKTSVSGRYGVGFFSIFMIAECVDIKSRRFDAASDDTIVLSFSEGLKSRPVLYSAEYTDRLTIGGTEIIIKLDRDKLSINDNYQLSSRYYNIWTDSNKCFESLVEVISMSFPVSTIPLKIMCGDACHIINGMDWMTEPAVELLKRVEGSSYPNDSGLTYESSVSLMQEEDGTIVGRGVLYPDRLSRKYSSRLDRIQGAVVSQGAKICTMDIRGVLLGDPIRASRDYAAPLISPEAMRRWAAHQGIVLQKLITEDEDQECLAEMISSLGGDIGDLKFCEVGGEYLNIGELRSFLAGHDEIWVAFNAGVSNVRPRDIASTRTRSCISVGCGIREVIPASMYDRFIGKRSDYGIGLMSIVNEVIQDEFEISSQVMEKMVLIENGHSVYSAEVNAWLTCYDEPVSTTGNYFRRNMTLGDVDEFFIPKDQRGKL